MEPLSARQGLFLLDLNAGRLPRQGASLAPPLSARDPRSSQAAQATGTSSKLSRTLQGALEA